VNISSNLPATESVSRLKVDVNDRDLDSLRHELLAARTQIAELIVKCEQAEDNRAALIHMSVELQVLRELACRNKDLEELTHDLRKSNASLLKKLHATEAKVEQAGFIAEKCRLLSLDNDSMKDKSEDQQTMKAMSLDLKRLSMSISKLERENRRLESNCKTAEESMTRALQENMILRQTIVQLQEELEHSIAFKNQLHQDVERERSLRADRELLQTKVQELQRDLSISAANNLELNEEVIILRKFRDELDVVEENNSELRAEITRLVTQIERSDLVIKQIDEYREQLRDQTKLNREQALLVHKLQNQLNEVTYYQTRNAEMLDEIHMYKIKVEKIPALLAETARLRAQSKASVKSVHDHDKEMASSTSRIKELEREVYKLKAENRIYHDSEMKLRDATDEIKRLSALIGELSAMKDEVKTAEDARRASENQAKKNRRNQRQSLLVAGGVSTASGIRSSGVTLDSALETEVGEIEDQNKLSSNVPFGGISSKPSSALFPVISGSD